MATIGVVGMVSTGKSSLVNYLVGSFVSPVSMKRCTMRPVVYASRHENQVIETKEEQKEIQNAMVSGILTESQIERLSKPITYETPTRYGVRVIDFPGFCDEVEEANNDWAKKLSCVTYKENTHDLFHFIIELKQIDIVIFVSNCRKFFTSKREITNFNIIKSEVQANINVGLWQQLIIVANGYDYDDLEIHSAIHSARNITGDTIVLPVSSWILIKNFCQRPESAEKFNIHEHILKRLHKGESFSGIDDHFTRTGWVNEWYKMKQIRGRPLLSSELNLEKIIGNHTNIIKAQYETFIARIRILFPRGLKNIIRWWISNDMFLLHDLVIRLTKVDKSPAKKVLAAIISSLHPLDSQSEKIIITYMFMQFFDYTLYDCLKAVGNGPFSFIQHAIECNIGSFADYLCSNSIEGIEEYVYKFLLLKCELSCWWWSDRKNEQFVPKFMRAIINSSGKIIIGEEITIDKNFMIELIPDIDIKNMFKLTSRGIKNLVAEIFTDDSDCREIFDAVSKKYPKMSFKNFKKCLAKAYFIDEINGKDPAHFIVKQLYA